MAAGLFAVYTVLQVPTLSVPLLIGTALAYALEPLAIRWESHGYSRGSILALIAGVLLFGIAAAALRLPSWLSEQWAFVQATAPKSMQNLREFLATIDHELQRQAPLLGDLSLAKSLNTAAAVLGNQVAPQIPGILAQVLVGALLTPVVAFFVLMDGRKTRKRLLRAVPNRHFEMALNIFHRIDQQIGAYLRGILLEAFLVGLIAFVVIAALGAPGAVLIGFVVGVTNLIPYFGPIAGGLTGVAYCILVSDLGAIWSVLAGITIAQLADNFVIGPLVLSKAVNEHPFVVIVLLLVAGKLFGLIGLVIAIPLWAVIRVVLQETAAAVYDYGSHVVD